MPVRNAQALDGLEVSHEHIGTAQLAEFGVSVASHLKKELFSVPPGGVRKDPFLLLIGCEWPSDHRRTNSVSSALSSPLKSPQLPKALFVVLPVVRARSRTARHLRPHPDAIPCQSMSHRCPRARHPRQREEQSEPLVPRRRNFLARPASRPVRASVGANDGISRGYCFAAAYSTPGSFLWAGSLPSA